MFVKPHLYMGNLNLWAHLYSSDRHFVKQCNIIWFCRPLHFSKYHNMELYNIASNCRFQFLQSDLWTVVNYFSIPVAQLEVKLFTQLFSKAVWGENKLNKNFFPQVSAAILLWTVQRHWTISNKIVQWGCAWRHSLFVHLYISTVLQTKEK